MQAVLCFAISAAQLFSLQIRVTGILLLASHSTGKHAPSILGAWEVFLPHSGTALWGQCKFGKMLLWECSGGTVAHQGLQRVIWAPK